MHSPQQVITKAMKFKDYWGKDGGITVSGGEPFMQLDFVNELLIEFKKRGISTCLETSGFPFTYDGESFTKFQNLLQNTDLLIVGLKAMDEEKHISLTGQNGHNAKSMLEYLASINKPIWIRYSLVPGLTDDEGEHEATSIYISSLGNVEKIEVIPNHLPTPESLIDSGKESKDIHSPSEVDIEKAKKILSKGLRKP